MDMDYEKLLERARKKLPEKTGKHDRFEMPQANSFVQGSKTILTNIGPISNYLNRDVNHMLKYLLGELGTAGLMDGNRAVFTGRFPIKTINEKVVSYVKEFVTCKECGSPDTKLMKEERIDYMKCMACQAKRPVAAMK